jgi:pimeloyl-ACP methyl ester carboxylesterase
LKKEYAVLFSKDQSLVGILNENLTAVDPGRNSLAGVLLLNAGLIHHIGPNRIYVKIARRLAALGFVVLRFDLSGIGDSGPRKDKMPFAESVINEVRQAMDYLEHFKGIKHFFCIGLCSGATAAAQISAADHRIKKAVLISPELPESIQIELKSRSSYYKKLFDSHSWFRFFSLRSNYREIFQVISMMFIKKFRPIYLRNSELSKFTTETVRFLRSLRTHGVKILIVFSEDDAGDRYIRGVIQDEYPSIQDSGLLKIEVLLESDHLITPLICQENLLNLISNWLTEKP